MGYKIKCWKKLKLNRLVIIFIIRNFRGKDLLLKVFYFYLFRINLIWILNKKIV